MKRGDLVRVIYSTTCAPNLSKKALKVLYSVTSNVHRMPVIKKNTLGVVLDIDDDADQIFDPSIFETIRARRIRVLFQTIDGYVLENSLEVITTEQH